MSQPEPNDSQNRESVLMLGELARGISHDLKNFLTAIQGNAEMALRSSEDKAAQERAMGMIIRASMSARDLCNQVLAYSQEKSLPRTVFDLREVLEEAKMLTEPALPENTQFLIEPGEETLAVEANHSQILQIILNLVANAIHAIGESGGTIHVRLSKNGQTCGIEVEDNGPGIAEEHHEHLFQPGYTTKVFGLATGLGLALVKRIVEEHEGSIKLTSQNGHGAHFIVALPLSDKEAESLKIEQIAPTKPKKKHNILLVDDEEFMRSLGIDILQSLGYRVSVRESGKTALELVKENPDYFDVILSDSRMPEMTGEQLAAAVQEFRPGIPFVLVTAFATSESGDSLKTQNITGVVAKPFLIDDLRKALDEALGL